MHRKLSRSYLERLDVKPHKHILNFPLPSGIVYPRQDKRNLTLGNYHRGKLQICAYATFSATTVQKFPVLYVCFHGFTRVDRSILRILRVLIVGADKITGANFHIRIKTKVSTN